MDGVVEWKGTSEELLAELKRKADLQTTRLKSWPRSAKGLTGQLKRLSTALRQTGLQVSFHRSDRACLVIITKNNRDKDKYMSDVLGNSIIPVTARPGDMTHRENTSAAPDTHHTSAPDSGRLGARPWLLFPNDGCGAALSLRPSITWAKCRTC